VDRKQTHSGGRWLRGQQVRRGPPTGQNYWHASTGSSRSPFSPSKHGKYEVGEGGSYRIERNQASSDMYSY
jgi:hypothetical protein